ncbi:MAG TPA: ABC-F family ATP-binding cassette domain-containing protein [Nocardioidaceae bacterium]|nr:ABC-F family ATP-binding cassette domain-containing protein [Nocardioidaceae bacterium]
MSTPFSVVLRDLSFAWPDGTPVLDGVTGTFGRGRTGLVGANGVGKSTLLRLIAGRLTPTSGTAVTSGTVDYLSQDVTRRADLTVADLLGITLAREALRAIEAGSTDPAVYDVLADDWDVEERARAVLSELGLPTDLDRPATSLSGGEAMLTAVSGVRLRRADVALLDEPTNNLDIDARHRLYDAVRGWGGALVVVSHDLELLDQLDETAELREHALSTYGGGYTDFRRWQDTQQESALQALRTAEQALKKERRERIKAEERIAHSERQGRKDAANRKYVPAAIDKRRNAAEKSQGSRRNSADAKVTAAHDAVQAAAASVRDDDRILVDLPDPGLPGGRRIVELRGRGGGAHVIQGPERVALVGPNGAGKTTLLEHMLPQGAVRVGYLPQRIVLDDDATVLDAVAASAPEVPRPELRNRLARLLIRGAMVDRRVGTLSGGERFRVALAGLLLAEPAHELLVLDEPTNDLDLTSLEQLVDALASYRGALLVVSHDRRFLERLGLDVTLRLDPDGVLRVS